MEQTFKPKKEEEIELEGLKAKFEAIKAKKVSRKVNLKMYNSCGCGSGYIRFDRIVPGDSPLQDGDVVEEADLEEDDVITHY